MADLKIVEAAKKWGAERGVHTLCAHGREKEHEKNISVRPRNGYIQARKKYPIFLNLGNKKIFENMLSFMQRNDGRKNTYN